MERNGEPSAAATNPEDGRSLDGRQAQAWRTVERVQERNAAIGPEEILADVTAEVEAVRRERHAQSESPEFETFRQTVRRLLTVSKTELDELRAAKRAKRNNRDRRPDCLGIATIR